MVHLHQDGCDEPEGNQKTHGFTVPRHAETAHDACSGSRPKPVRARTLEAFLWAFETLQQTSEFQKNQVVFASRGALFLSQGPHQYIHESIVHVW